MWLISFYLNYSNPEKIMNICLIKLLFTLKNAVTNQKSSLFVFIKNRIKWGCYKYFIHSQNKYKKHFISKNIIIGLKLNLFLNLLLKLVLRQKIWCNTKTKNISKA